MALALNLMLTNRCVTNCIYCYANGRSREQRRMKDYDPEGEMLYGTLSPEDTVIPLKGRDVPKLEEYFEYTQYGNVPSLRK